MTDDGDGDRQRGETPQTEGSSASTARTQNRCVPRNCWMKYLAAALFPAHSHFGSGGTWLHFCIQEQRGSECMMDE